MTETVKNHAWKVPVSIDEVPEAGRHFKLVADETTRAAIATDLGLRSLEELELSCDVTRRGRDGLHVEGQVKAIVGQSCVVTLEPIKSEVIEDLDIDFLAAVEEAAAPSDLEGETEPPELLVDGAIDLGAMATEFLILGINPYPRKPGATFVAPASENSDGGPFAALAKLKPSSDKEN